MPNEKYAKFNSKLLKYSIEKFDIVQIEKGNYYLQGPINLTGLHRRQIQNDGNLIFLDNYETYPYGDLPGTTANQRFSYADLWRFEDCHYIKIFGKGTIDGQGFRWWNASLSAFLGHKVLATDNRPKLLHFYQSSNLEISSIRLVDSPMFHLYLEDVANVTVTDLSVFVHTKKHFLDKKPVWPLNTDGIDPQGINITIRNFVYHGFDDAIAVKPQNLNTKYSSCSTNILIDGVKIYYGIGVDIPSVPERNCIDGVTVRNVQRE